MMPIVWTSARTRARLFRLAGVRVGLATVVWGSFVKRILDLVTARG